jgi:signal transduction histidine kinase
VSITNIERESAPVRNQEETEVVSTMIDSIEGKSDQDRTQTRNGMRVRSMREGMGTVGATPMI